MKTNCMLSLINAALKVSANLKGEKWVKGLSHQISIDPDLRISTLLHISLSSIPFPLQVTQNY